MRQLFLFLFLTSITFTGYSQEVDSLAAAVESEESESVKGTWDLNLDLASRYIWRGQSWGGNHPVAQVYGTYNITEKLSFGIWTTHNFQNKAVADNEIDPKGYQEIDFVFNYAFTDYLTTSLQWYYWPYVEEIEGVSHDFFDFGNTSVNTLDLMFMFDFSERGVPLWFTWSTLIAGNDYKYANEEDVDGKQNYTSYAEVGYSYDLPFWGLNLSPVIGAVINNDASYYTYGDTDKISFVNMGARLTKEFTLSDNLTLPIWINYTHNGASKEFSAPEGSNDIKQDYIVFGATLSFAK